MILTSDKFEDTIKNGVTLIDFYAEWCGPCKMLAPILEQVEAQIGDNAKVFKMDVDECADIAQKLGIMSVPTMIIFKNGEEQDRMIGLRQKQQIIDAVNKQI